MHTIENILTRTSVKGYAPDKPVKRELIEKIVEAGIYAPSGRNLQSPIILAVTNKELRDELSRLNGLAAGVPEGTDMFYGAPVVLVVLADKTKHTYLYDGSLVMGNLMLAAHELGVGSCWIHRAKETFETPEGKAILKKCGIEGDFEGIGNCVLGYPLSEEAEIKPRKANRVYYAD